MGLSFFLGIYLDFFDRKILDVPSRKDESLTLTRLVLDSGFVRSAVPIYLERLGSEGLVLKEKQPSKGRGRPELLYRPADIPQPRTAPQLSVVALEFSKRKKACNVHHPSRPKRQRPQGLKLRPVVGKFEL
jgi:hypothetical protein